MRRPPLSVFSSGFVAGAVAVVAPAQQPAPVRGQGLVEITRAAADESVSGMPPWMHGCGPARNGALFVLVTRATFAGPGRTGAAKSVLELWRSDDAGTTWRRTVEAPSRGIGDGSFVADGDHLAVVWTATAGGQWSNAFWQRYDVARDVWLGEPVQLTAATGEQDQYFATDLARTANGTLVVAIGSHRTPPAPTWNCGWSTGMRWLPPGDTQWRPLQQVNADSYGCSGNMLVRGDLVDFTFRSNPSEAAHALRTFDAVRGALREPSPPITPANPSPGDYTANIGIWCSDGTDGRTLLYMQGKHEAGGGRLVASFARGEGEFRAVRVAEDAPLIAGNETHVHFTLARGPGNQVLCYFAKAEEQFAVLWQCLLEDGAVVAAPRPVMKGDARQFQMLNGMRQDDAFTGLHVVVTSRTDKDPGGIVSAFGSWPSRTIRRTRR